MRLLRNTALGTLFLAAGLLAQNPLPAAVVNPASNTPIGHPFWGIAQGSIFVVYPAFDVAGKVVGGPLGPPQIAIAPTLPLGTDLAGTSIQVTIGNNLPVKAFIVYTLNSQVAAVLPSGTPIGAGTLTLTYNGLSGSTPINVVQSNFGISTINQTGAGPGVVTSSTIVNNAFPVLTATTSAKPGDVLVIWGTGLGADPKNDNTFLSSGDLGTPINIWVGGVKVTSIIYRGRSGAPGLDQINFTVPAGVQPGCRVSLVVQTGPSLFSNTTTIPVATNGGACSDTGLQGISSSVYTPLLGQSVVKLAAIDMEQSNELVPNGATVFSGKALAYFLSFTQPQFQSLVQQSLVTTDPSLGSCVVTFVLGSPPNPATNTPLPASTGLDAGSTVLLTPPSGPALRLSTVQGTPGSYSATPTSTIIPGQWNESSPTGGNDIGLFSTNYNVPAQIIWTNSLPLIDRTQPFTVKWTGGDANGWVGISGSSSFGTNANNGGTANFQCSAPEAAQQFTIPISVLMNLQATGAGGSGFLQLQGHNTITYSLSPLDLAFLTYKSTFQYAPSWK